MTDGASARTGRSLSLFRLRILTSIIVLAGLVVASYFSWQLSQRVAELRKVPLDNAQWNMSQLEVDFLQLDIATQQLLMLGAPALEPFRKRYDIFYSRVGVVGGSRNSEEIREIPQMLELYDELAHFLEETVVWVDAPDNEMIAAAPRFQQQLRNYDTVPRKLALMAVELTSRLSDFQRREILRLLQIIGAVSVIVMVALTVAFLTVRLQKAELDRRSRKLQRAAQMRDSTLRASLDAIVVIDHRGRITDFNGSAEQIFGRARDDVFERPFDLLIPEGQAMEPRDGLPHAAADQQDRSTGVFDRLVDKGRVQLSAQHARGHAFPIEISVSETEGHSGSQFVCYIRDITQDRRTQKELQSARDQAVSAYREKSRFFAVMSHEMRTPLNGILSALELMRDEPQTTVQARYTAIAETSSNILLGHINDVLSIERLDSGEVRMQSVPVDATALIDELVENMQPQAGVQGTELEARHDGDPVAVLGDPKALQQIVLNLLSNAIKFCAGGRVEVVTRHESRPGDMVAFVVAVTDTGIGMSDENQKSIFDDFVTLSSPYERTATGTGLGLGIARRLVERLGGRLDCISAPDRGSAFTVELLLPLGQNSLPTRLRRVQERVAPEMAALEVLIVEDNQINRELLEIMLNKLGHSVSVACDGFEGVHLAGKRRFDVILMDISMPGMNGIRATRQIRQSRGLSRDVPIHALTAHAMPEEIAEFKAAGMAGCLAKPIRSAELAVLLSQIAKTRSGGMSRPSARALPVGHGLSRPTSADRPEDQAEPLLDAAQLDDLRALLSDANLRVRIRAFLTEGCGFCDTIAARAQARDVEGMRDFSHSFAGSCATFGAKLMFGQLQDIEQDCKSCRGEAATFRAIGLAPIWSQTRAALEAYSNTLAESPGASPVTTMARLDT